MPVLGYWAIRGLAQPIRILLHYVGEDFEDKYYECGPAPEFNRDMWLNEKNKLGLAFPNAQVSCEAAMSSENRVEGDRKEIKKYIPGRLSGFSTSVKFDTRSLPYYIDGDIKITQSNAILRYIGRKHNLCGKTPQEMVNVDMLVDQAMDFRNGLVRIVYNPRYDDIIEAYLKDLPNKLRLFENFIGDKKFFCSDEVTFVDFPMYELLDQHRIMAPTCLDKFPKLKAFIERFVSIDSVKKYMNSDKFLKAPINNKMAKFGYE